MSAAACGDEEVSFEGFISGSIQTESGTATATASGAERWVALVPERVWDVSDVEPCGGSG